MPLIASVEEIRSRFGVSTPRRQFLFQRLQTIIQRLRATQEVKQIYLFGSFLTGKDSPNDIDLLIVMNSTFTTANLRGKDLEVFQHDVCRILFHADVFWVTETVGVDRIDELLDVFSRDREGHAQPIIEVQP
jgi:predicted nucleotidyltransferase